MMLGSLPHLMTRSILVSLGCILLLATGLSRGEKRNVTHFVFSVCQFESFFFLSPTSPGLEGASEEVHGHSTTRVSKSKWVAEQRHSVICWDLGLF